jgi:acyl carrier protein
MEENKAKIRAFLSRHIHNQNLQDDVDIFASGFVNSLFAMQLVLFVEGEFGVQLGNEDLRLDNFRSITALADLVERKSNGVA